MVTTTEGAPSAGPLVTITFTDGSRSVVRYWYHVPRIGEQVYLMGAAIEHEAARVLGEMPSALVGTVRAVRWDSDGSCQVWLR